VLSIGKLTADNADYCQRTVAKGADDYYAGKGEAVGEWQGEGADALGLQGGVAAQTFQTVLIERRSPDTGEVLADPRSRTRVLAYDLTFSAPKSVSVLFAIADERTSRALRDAHDEAVATARAYLEREACQVRRGHAGEERQQAQGFISAAYRHRMSRAQDPQLHTHVVTANLARGEDGRYSALDGYAIYRHARAAGYLYEAHLRYAVRQRLPWVRWSTVTKGIADIEGVSDEVRREFSRRRAEIEEWLEREGKDGRRSAEKAALATRQPKHQELDTPSWRESVRARAAEHGLGRSELAALTRGEARGPRPVDAGAVESQLVGPAGLTERRNVFATRDAVVEWAAAHRDGAPVERIEAAASRFLKRPEVVPVQRRAEPSFTTEELLEHERAIVEGVAARRGEGAATVAMDEIEDVLASRNGRLTDQQQAAVLAIATSGHGVENVEALAGTGKTYLAGALRDVYDAGGNAVVGVAPTGRAARELRERAGIAEAQTLARLLLELDSKAAFDSRTVVILDEAGMAGTRESASLLDAARRAGAKVIAIGDSGQLASVQAGGWLGSLTRRFGARELTEVMRQRDAAERQLLAQVHSGRPAAYLRHKRNRGELRLYESAPEAERALVGEWQARQAELPDGQAVMIARDNATRERLNTAARTALRAEGHLGEGVEIGDREFAGGDRVIVRRNDRHHDVDNGMRGTIRTIDRKTGAVTIETDASGLRELPLGYVADHLEHAYALTGHGMQGGTVEWAGVAGAPPEFTRNWSYTALSRARQPTEIYLIADEDRFAAERAEIAPAERHATSPVQRTAQAMRRRDDEDLALDWVEPAQLPRGREPSTHTRPSREPARQADLDLDLAPAVDLRRELEAIETRLERVGDVGGRAGAERALAERTIAEAREGISTLERTREGDPREIAYERQRVRQAERMLRTFGAEEIPTSAQPATGDSIEEQATDLRVRRDELRRALDQRREAHIREAVSNPGPHLVRGLGDPPADRQSRTAWERGAVAIERYRFDQDLRGPSPLGDRPADRAAAAGHRRAQRELAIANRRLGRELAHTSGREI